MKYIKQYLLSRLNLYEKNEKLFNNFNLNVIPLIHKSKQKFRIVGYVVIAILNLYNKMNKTKLYCKPNRTTTVYLFIYILHRNNFLIFQIIQL